MLPPAPHAEHHLIARVGWLRAAVLGANDGIISTSSLIVGVASATPDHAQILLAGVAGLVAGALSMAAGEYVSVSSQSDTERADLAKEAHELRVNTAHETRELADIYKRRGLDDVLAQEVARQLMAKDPLAAHARDELGITDISTAQPVQAAWSSACSFAVGGAVPVLIALLSPASHVVPFVYASTLISLALLGALGAKAGGSPMLKGVLRVTLWGAVAMAATAAIGSLFGTPI